MSLFPKKTLTPEDKKKRRRIRIVGSLVGMAVIAAAISLYYYYWEHAEWLEHIPLMPGEMQAITEITCQQGDAVTTYTLDGATWSDPTGAAVAEQLQKLTAIHILVRPGALSEYGLDDSAATHITARDAAGHAVALLLGHDHGNNSYAKLADGQELYLVNRALADALR